LPLIAYDDLHSFKLYLFDVGVLRQLSNLDPGAFVDKNRLFTEFKGALTENYILQSLRRQLDVIPRYWTSQNEAEVDFIIQYKNKIIPAEVKSDENVRSKSLAFYNERFNPDIRIRYSMKNLTYDDNLINIPLFMADMTNIILDKYFENQIN
jgi:predicted AAA+ superfamily ATPase